MSHSTMAHAGPLHRAWPRFRVLERYLSPLGRALFSFIFVTAAPGHFRPESIQYAAQHGVPFAGLLVPLSGVMATAGGLSVLLGYRARLGAWLIVLFLVPVTLTMHDFWNVQEPGMRGMQYAMFLKNLAMLGGALFLTRSGAGPISFDERRKAGRRGHMAPAA